MGGEGEGWRTGRGGDATVRYVVYLLLKNGKMSRMGKHWWEESWNASAVTEKIKSRRPSHNEPFRMVSGEEFPLSAPRTAQSSKTCIYHFTGLLSDFVEITLLASPEPALRQTKYIYIFHKRCTNEPPTSPGHTNPHLSLMSPFSTAIFQ